jgi:Trypsin
MARVQFLAAPGSFGAQGGGVIIAQRHILTSSFVLMDNFQVLNVWIGATSRFEQHQVFPSHRILHPNYTQNPRTNDIGIIVLTADIEFNEFVQKIALPMIGSQMPYLNEQGTVLGFGGLPGNTNPQQLEAAFMRIVTPARCNTQFPAHVVGNQFCAEDTRMRSDICSDDIGGPVITLVRGVDVLTGISSVHRCLDNNIASQPSLFTRVSSYREWIQTQVGI